MNHKANIEAKIAASRQQEVRRLRKLGIKFTDVKTVDDRKMVIENRIHLMTGKTFVMEVATVEHTVIGSDALARITFNDELCA